MTEGRVPSPCRCGAAGLWLPHLDTCDAGRTPSPVGARVKFRDDHPDYPGMVGTVTDRIDLPGMEPTVGVLLDAVPATADEIEPWSDDV